MPFALDLDVRIRPKFFTDLQETRQRGDSTGDNTIASARLKPGFLRVGRSVSTHVALS